MKIPTEADWRSESWCVDMPRAYERFYGKDLDEAFELFVENALSYQEDIMFMPLTCFRYYVQAYASYLLSEASEGDSDGANCFFCIVKYRAKDIRSSVAVVVDQITRTLGKLKQKQAWYDADDEIYGSFEAQASACLKHLQVS